MTAVILNFIRDDAGGIEKSATFYKKITIKDSNKILYNLTGFTAKMQIRVGVGKPVILELSSANSRITLGGTLGTIELTVDKTTTASLSEGKYVYDLFLTNGTTSTKILEGAFHIYPSITV